MSSSVDKDFVKNVLHLVVRQHFVVIDFGMGKIYDDWERLVTAVARRERDRLLALNDSTSTSISSSSQLSFSSISPLPMDYSNLSIHRDEWKAMLPPGKQEVVWRSSSMRFFLDGRTGKNCFLLGSMSPDMVFGDCWKIDSHPLSRFSCVAELTERRQLYMEGIMNTKMLSQKTCYAAYLVFRFADMYQQLHSAVSIIRNYYDESGEEYPEEQARMVRFQEGENREDGWMEILLGEFYVELEGNGDVQVQLLDTSGYNKSGLIVEGIEFRPFNSII